MKQITITVKSNRDIKNDTQVNVRIDTDPIWRNEVTLYFENGDYCDINIKKFYETGRYISTYLNMYVVDVFKKKLQDGEITFEKVGQE